MKKRIIALSLSLCMLLSMLPAVAFAADSYDDIAGHWAAEAIELCSGYGVVSGDGTGNFNPDSAMTRAQMAQVICNLLGLTTTADISNYSDVSEDAWYAEAIACCVAAGVLNGTGDSTMEPEAAVTLEQMLVILARALGIQAAASTSSTTLSALDTVSDWAAGYVYAMAEAGYIQGSNGELALTEEIDRASAMSLLSQIIPTYVETKTEDIAKLEHSLTVCSDDSGAAITCGEDACDLSGLSYEEWLAIYASMSEDLSDYTAAIEGALYADLASAIEAAASGATITLLADIALADNEDLAITQSVVLDGQNHSISGSAQYLISVNTGSVESTVVLKNLNITNALAYTSTDDTGGGRAIGLGTSGDLSNLTMTLEGCTITAYRQGIGFGGNTNTKITLTVENTVMNQANVTDANKTTYADMNIPCRGISICNLTDSTVSLENCELNGWKYGIDVLGDSMADNGLPDTTDLVVNVVSSTVRGYTCLYVWGSYATYNLTDSTFLGINTSDGFYDYGYALVESNYNYNYYVGQYAYTNLFNITDCTITNYQSGTSLEQLLEITCDSTVLTLSGTVTFIETTGNISSALCLDYQDDPPAFMENNVIISDGATIVLETVEGNAFTLSPDYQVIYVFCWEDGEYYRVWMTFEEPLLYEYLCDEDQIELYSDVALTENMPLTVSTSGWSEEGTATIYLILGDYSITGAQIILPIGVSIITDAEVDELFAAESDGTITKTVSTDTEAGTIYTYTCGAAVADGSETE